MSNVIGRYGMGIWNKRGEHVIDFCRENNVTNIYMIAVAYT